MSPFVLAVPRLPSEEHETRNTRKERMLESRRPTSPARTFVTAPDTSAKFGEITAGGLRPVEPEPEADFVAIVRSPELDDLRRAFRKITTRLSAVALVSYFSYVAASAYLPQFMSTPLFGAVSVGLVLALAQFATVLLVTALYARSASRQLDPRVNAIHDTFTEGRLS